MQKYYYEQNKPSRTLTVRQYIYRIGQYRYNWHKALEILLVVRGTVEMSCGGETILMEEDDLLLIDSNVGHASLSKKENSIAMVLHLEPEYLEDYYNPIKNWTFSGHTDSRSRKSREAAKIRGLLASMITHGGSLNPLDQIMYEQELNGMLGLLFGLFPPKCQADTDYIRTEKQKGLIEKMLNYVEDHYREKISLQDLSRICPYNPSYLSVYFKNHVGVNFYDYLTRVRVREATLELCSTDNSVLEVAHNHGFADVKAFNTAFRKTFGKAPMEYRRQILAENRGKELLEKRTFLPVDDEEVNRKLTEYHKAAGQAKGEGLWPGNGLLQKELAENLKKQVEDSREQLQVLQRQMEEIRRRAEELETLL